VDVQRKFVAGAIVAVACVGALAGCAGGSAPSSAHSGGATHAPVITFARQASPPPLAATPTGPGYVGMIDSSWALATSEATGIPRRAVLAYAGAAVRAAEVYPDCGIGWNTLAGIGLIESDHGSFGGSSIGADFRVNPDIYGPILDGGDTANIPDTDEGLIDGITQFDRAVGPMQLIPATWASWPSDGNGDAVPDPQNIADESIAAANSLCRASGGMSTPDGWRAGIASYNAGSAYLKAVASAAQRYVDAAK
jgi:membrane-bound lytic murein transglycosylase B